MNGEIGIRITKIENPTWNGKIKEILSPHSSSFGLCVIPNKTQLVNHWWEYKDIQGMTLGFGWIDFALDESGQAEA